MKILNEAILKEEEVIINTQNCVVDMLIMTPHI